MGKRQTGVTHEVSRGTHLQRSNLKSFCPLTYPSPNSLLFPFFSPSVPIFAQSSPFSFYPAHHPFHLIQSGPLGLIQTACRGPRFHTDLQDGFLTTVPRSVPPPPCFRAVAPSRQNHLAFECRQQVPPCSSPAAANSLTQEALSFPPPTAAPHPYPALGDFFGEGEGGHCYH